MAKLLDVSLERSLTCSRLLSTCVYRCEQDFGFHLRTDIALFPGSIDLRLKNTYAILLDLNAETSLRCSACQFYAFAYAQNCCISVQAGICPAPGSYSSKQILDFIPDRSLPCFGLLSVCVYLCENVFNFNLERLVPCFGLLFICITYEGNVGAQFIKIFALFWAEAERGTCNRTSIGSCQYSFRLGTF